MEKTSHKLENGSADYLKAEERKRSFLRSIAAYLEKHGFSNTLAAFQSEGQLQLEEADSLKGHSLDLDDIFCKFVESCKDSVKGSTGYQEDQDVEKSHVNQKKEKKGSGADDMPSKHKFDNHNGNKSNALVVDGMQEKAKERKRKKRPRADSIEETPGEVVQARVHEEIALENGGNHKNESNIESKSKKKKKVMQEFIEEKSEVLKPSTEASCQPDKLNTISKVQKKKKHKLASGSPGKHTDQVGTKRVQESLHNETKTEPHATENDGESKSRERKKKRHNTHSEHLDAETIEDLDGVMVHDEKKDIDGNQEDLSKLNLNNEKSPVSKKSTSSRDEKTEMDPYSLSKKKTNAQKGSVEPKSVNVFQRVKINEVEFADERLQDNSYWAKGGADSGYGAKAQESLGQVRGRDFRHEKTKKKRGSYRGGQIDLRSHSIKFNYSDDE